MYESRERREARRRNAARAAEGWGIVYVALLVAIVVMGVVAAYVRWVLG